MRAMKGRIGPAVRAILLMLVASSCTVGTTEAGTDGSASSNVPNPFRIVTTYTARSLGLKHVLHLTVGPDGNVYVTDVRQQVAVVSPEGDVLRTWGEPGDGPGQFAFDPHAPQDPFDINARLAVGPDGRVYVIDPGNRRVEIFDPFGHFLGDLEGDVPMFAPNFVAVDAENMVYVTDGATSTLTKFSPEGRVVWRIGGTEQPNLVGEGHIFSVDAHGRLLLGRGDGLVEYIDVANHQVVDQLQTGACDATVDARGDVYANADVDGCEGGFTRVYDREHHLLGAWYGRQNPLAEPPMFTPDGEAFALISNGAIGLLEIALPGA
jgi:DNA-binding beta-propeller fold protein YncE